MRTLSVSGTTLFHIAAAELGSALQWITVARMNQISDPMITSLTTLKIPSRSALFEDGIGPQ